RIAFPRAALRHEIALERGERHAERTALAVRAQARVDAKHVAVGIDVPERGDDSLPEPVEEFAAGNALRAVGFAFFGINEDEVDVGRNVELTSAELPHADDDQLLNVVACIAARQPERRGERSRMQLD